MDDQDSKNSQIHSLGIVQRHCAAARIAFSLLTRIPFGIVSSDSYQDSVSLSRLYYPAVGLVLGLILAGSTALLLALPTHAVAAIIALGIWVALSGALHLDGLADSIDALAASHKHQDNRDKLLSIMREPTCGPMASIALCMILILKGALLYDVLSRDLFYLLIPALIFPRLMASLYMMLTPYARDSGIASDLQGRTHIPALIALFVCCYFGCLFLPTLNFFTLNIAVCTAGLLFILWRELWMKRIQGYTGDTVGALIELSEVVLLITLVSLFSA